MPSITVKELLERHPLAVEVFLKMKLHCAGCPTEAYHSLEDVACIYHRDLDALLNTLERAISTGQATDGPQQTIR